MNKKRYLIIVGVMVAAVLLLASSCMGIFITSLEADAEWTAPLSSIEVTCNVSGSDGDGLSYEWSTTGGDVAGTGAIVDWIAPEEVGMYDVTVVVTDGEDGQDTASITLIASNGPPPVIQDLIVTADHKYLKESPDGYKVGKGHDYSIECVASSNTSGEMVYEWSCTNGLISGEGSIIAWSAPDTACDVTVTVKVFDGLGNWVSKGVLLEVVECTSCTFG
jgi:hypothetical protein